MLARCISNKLYDPVTKSSSDPPISIHMINIQHTAIGKTIGKTIAVININRMNIKPPKYFLISFMLTVWFVQIEIK
jgi:hypothetical protein